uniref:DUF4373 domain-containing protein n=1 Tax=Aerococcus urinaeequi TaxID=51665 RepID=UPI00352BA155
MARDAFYFPHDSNARQDTKILKLRIKHGWAGYGLYWGIIEALRDQDNYSFDTNEPELISLAVGCSVDELIPVLETCIEVGLLVNEDGEIYSKSLKRRMEHVNEIREKRREAGRKGGMARQRESTIEANVAQEESNAQANDEQMLSKCLANEKQMLSSKGKEIKEKERESKEKERESKEKERVLNTLSANASVGLCVCDEPSNDVTEEQEEQTEDPPCRTKGQIMSKTQLERFNQFWYEYPKKKAKVAAMKAWAKLKPDDVLFDAIMLGLRRARASIEWKREGGRFIPHPATFLNQGRWEDEYLPFEQKPTRQDLRNMSTEEYLQTVLGNITIQENKTYVG